MRETNPRFVINKSVHLTKREEKIVKDFESLDGKYIVCFHIRSKDSFFHKLWHSFAPMLYRMEDKIFHK